ncbi:Tripartite tricarboxylate transporter family receptor [Pigmentiphaga humi]|uniref:Tripartite tricarboxylate transporter family receptor n=1 Tax=Pigmentiphaga humi TaxID=2478468 RepID=A0A3P4AZI2_9BURK|nr:tripartite tricarboxylate transporter substrate-binding protein [Pigmentiphaga humi]VCU68776.1 Tripartite tricarboxylate transporter family receptor [Pigmentiphaga humi]
MKILGKLCGSLALAFAASTASMAQSPPLRIIVPMAPGGGIDTLARMMAPPLSRKLDRTVVVENMPGAAGIIATDYVAKSKGEGIPLLLTSNNITINPYLFKSLPFNVLTDLQPVAKTTTMPMLLLAHPSVPVNDVQELIGYAKANPGKLSYASPGTGTPHHLGMELLKIRAGIDLAHVPYKGTPPGLVDVLGGHVPLIVSVVTPVAEAVRSGKLKALGTLEKQPVAGFETVAPLARTLSGFEVEVWHGVYASRSVPKATVDQVSRAVREVMADPGMAEKLNAAGIVPQPGTGEELAALTADDLKKWEKVVQQAGIKPE